MGFHGFDNRFDRAVDGLRGRYSETGRFGRLFPELRSHKGFTSKDAKQLGLALDGGTPAPGSPEALAMDNPRIKAGYTFFGQFIDHDLTFDPTSILEQQIDPEATRNFRTPAFELDSLYGQGPRDQPYLYDGKNPGCFLLAAEGRDLARNSQEVALIGDPRNDENIIVSQLHLAFLKFHNRVFTDFTTGTDTGARFQEAQTLVRWHYQWLVLKEFLPRIVGTQTAERALQNTRFIFKGEPFIPVEFSVAVYRFGHSMVRAGYGINDTGGAPIFSDTAPTDLRGGRIVPPNLVVDWKRFFGTAAQPSFRIDSKLSSPLTKLPPSVVGSAPNVERSLAVRNLQRGIDARLPSGDMIARYLALPHHPALRQDELWGHIADKLPGRTYEAPLWYYILREAEVRGEGQRLAGVGAEIVANLFVAVMRADRASFLAQEPDWRPTLGENGKFTLADLANLAERRGSEGAPEKIESEDLTTLPGDEDTPLVIARAAE
ncbi:heme peroxidase [Azorhizobium oxalatiphilum]|uniref:Heme peroxidase n=1 Tax=Azorhizobium oxalatiphilum TaxID=980631 RepID=A0A917CAM0_9HYPH|nr:heme peroxidase family protein [Azorhizobium oxalatiphilum]GGF79676.1 heme peroxidase [Azorhizobium oxalatiphilum]